MNLWQTSMKRAALVLVAAAVVAPTAQAAQSAGRTGASTGGRPAVGQPTANELAQQELTALSSNHPHVSSAHLQALMATANNSVRDSTASSVKMEKPASAGSGGFDWSDAGIGATSGFAFALILAGTLLFLLRRKPREEGAGTPRTV